MVKVHMLGVIGMYGKDIFLMEDLPLLWKAITCMSFNEIRWFKILLKHPKMSCKSPLDSITNLMLTVTLLSFDTLSVHL